MGERECGVPVRVLGLLQPSPSLVPALDLSHNHLSALPDDLSSLAHLASLNLSHNQFQAVPEGLRQLPALREVNLSSNQIAAVQAVDFDPMQSLESVDLRGNPLFPDSKQVLQSMIRIRVEVDD